MEQKSALIFDLDGTLWDAASQVCEIWNLVGQKYLGPSFHLSADDVRSLMGKPMSQILKEVAPSLPEGERTEAFKTEFLYSEILYLSVHPGQLFPKEKETLLALKEAGYPLYIVSNCQTGYIENFLRVMPNGLFLDHMCWSDTKAPKSVTIKALMERNGIEKAIYIGDTLGDETETHLAGLPFLHADYGFGACERPEGRLAAFEDLPRVLGQMKDKSELDALAERLNQQDFEVHGYLSSAQIEIIKQKTSSEGMMPTLTPAALELIEGFLKANGTMKGEYLALKEAWEKAQALRGYPSYPQDVAQTLPMVEGVLGFDLLVLLGIVSQEEVAEMADKARAMMGGGTPSSHKA